MHSVHSVAASSARDAAEPSRSADLVVHLDRCLATARAIAASEDLARDAVQEALILFWTAESEPADVRGWLVRTTAHRALHHSRIGARRARREEFVAANRAELDPSGDPRLALEARELGAEIARAIRALPDEYRVVFELYELVGLDYDAIASRVGAPLGTVRSRLARARRSLRRRLERWVEFDPDCALCRDRQPSGATSQSTPTASAASDVAPSANSRPRPAREPSAPKLHAAAHIAAMVPSAKPPR